jgi:hypothetical protein
MQGAFDPLKGSVGVFGDDREDLERRRSVLPFAVRARRLAFAVPPTVLVVPGEAACGYDA